MHKPEFDGITVLEGRALNKMSLFIIIIIIITSNDDPKPSTVISDQLPSG